MRNTLKSKNRVIIVTGLSGAGMTSALKIFEDLGYEAVDNLPYSLLQNIINQKFDGSFAIGIDVRSRDFDGKKLAEFIKKYKKSLRINLIYFDCDTDIIINRYKETRRPHPLKLDLPIKDIIKQERIWLEPLSKTCDHLIDTTHLNVINLKQILSGNFLIDKNLRLNIRILSFGYKYGIPREADMILDMRFLKNPFYLSSLKNLTGKDEKIIKFIENQDAFNFFFKTFIKLFKKIIPLFLNEGKNYVTIAFGCTGGIHRSVMIADRFSKAMKNKLVHIHVAHRDLKR
tara:strand:- start:4475 stop:5335 length:861 start_codon:yes stop_codon:yes gene_type:complete